MTLFKKWSRIFSTKPKSVAQLVTIIRDSQRRHIIDQDSLRMIEGSLTVSQTPVEEIMVARAEITFIDKEMTFEEVLKVVSKSTHSRFPVMGENKDEIIGILLAKDLLKFCQQAPESHLFLKEILRPALFVPESKRLSVLLNEFRKNRNHLAIVVDEYGGVSGLVTIEDVLEQIVGEIEDEYDIDKGIFIRKHKAKYYTVKSLTPIEEFNRFFHTDLSDEEFDTVGGLVMKAFGHLPKRGEAITVSGIPFKVLRANDRRIQLLQTSLEPLKEEAE